MRQTIMNRIKKMPFSRQMLLCTAPVIIAAYLVSCGVFLHVMEGRLRDDAAVNMRDVTDRSRYYIESHLNSVYGLFTNFESDQALYNLKSGLGRNRDINTIANYYVDLDVLLKSSIAANQNCLGAIYINFNDGALMVQKYTQFSVNVNYNFADWKARYPEPMVYFVSAQEEPDVSGADISAIMFRLYESSDINGIVLYAIKSDFFTNILTELEVYDDSEFYILTGQGEQLKLKGYEYRMDLPRDTIERIMAGEEAQMITADDGQYIYATPINNTDWKLVLRVPEESVMENAAVLTRFYLAVAAVSAVGLCLLIVSFTRFVSSPLKKLTDRVTEMKNESLQAVFDVDGCKEINILNTELTRMHDYSQELMEQIRTERDLKRKAELLMLQEQIKPHFLYNSLYSIQQLCQLGDNEQAAQMIGALSSFYRLGISGGDNIIPIQKELEHVDNYLQIQKMRYYDQFDYVIDCDPVICHYEIPKLVLQPLVENAIYHGIKQSKRKGFISITGSLDGEDILLEVHDDGAGITEERLEAIRAYLSQEDKGEMNSIGLKNVDYRIKKTFGEQYGITIRSEKDVDTCVSIRLAMTGDK